MCALREPLGGIGRIEISALLLFIIIIIIIIQDSFIIIIIIGIININYYYYLEFYIVPTKQVCLIEPKHEQ